MENSRGTYDAIVVGLGAMGAATLLHLARRGMRVLGIDRFSPPHSMGSSHGDTRITRLAIGEGEQYVPLVTRSHEIWREIEAETGESLLVQCGALVLSPASSAAIIHGKENFVRRTIAAAERYAVPHEVIGADETMRRYPQFRLRGDEIVYFEPGGGYVRPERCIAAQLALAARAGAETLTGCRVLSVSGDRAGGVSVATDRGMLSAGQAVLAAGAWSPGLAGAPLAPAMEVQRQVLHWWEPKWPEMFSPSRCPVYIWMHGDGPEDCFYGFPVPPGTSGVKVAADLHPGPTPDPDLLERAVGPGEASAMYRHHLAGRIPDLMPVAIRSAVCPFTMTPDGDFLVTRVPGDERVLLVSACSGHGFKHSAGLGEAVAAAVAGEDDSILRTFAAT